MPRAGVKRELQRQKTIKRIAGQANSTNYPSTGPTGASGSAGYATRLSALFNDNITLWARQHCWQPQGHPSWCAWGLMGAS